MQTSGTFPQLSDGTRKTIVGAQPPKASVPRLSPAATPKPSNHRRGGYAKHQKGGK